MAKIAQAGVALNTELWVSATKHTSVSALTETTIETFISGTPSKEVKYPSALTGIGAESNFVTSPQLGQDVASQYRGQPTPPTLTFSMDANPTDVGQAIVLAAGSNLLGFSIKIVGADGGIRYKAFNGYVDFVENVSPDSAYTMDVSVAVENVIKTVDDSA